jgi:hypothetical protein
MAKTRLYKLNSGGYEFITHENILNINTKFVAQKVGKVSDKFQGSGYFLKFIPNNLKTLIFSLNKSSQTI